MLLRGLIRWNQMASQRTPRFSFSLPTVFLKGAGPGAGEGISLNNQQMGVLGGINSYEQSLEYLRKNQLHQSLRQLQYCLSQVRDTQPHMINVQGWLISRTAVLYKLLNQFESFENSLQELYLLSVSQWGQKSLRSLHHLINYLTCLATHQTRKLQPALEFQPQPLNDSLTFFEALNEILNKKNYQRGIDIIDSLSEENHFEVVFKLNNLAALQAHSILKQPSLAATFKPQSSLKFLLKALIQSQNNPPDAAAHSQAELSALNELIKHMQSYIKGQSEKLPNSGLLQGVLRGTNSHVIAMNIAVNLLAQKQIPECLYFTRLCLEKAVADKELERVGMAMLVLARCQSIQKNDKWEDTCLQLLENASVYPKNILKQTLLTYSQLLAERGRMYEAQSYFMQAQQVVTQECIQGLILPIYDFSY